MLPSRVLNPEPWIVTCQKWRDWHHWLATKVSSAMAWSRVRNRRLRALQCTVDDGKKLALPGIYFLYTRPFGSSVAIGNSSPLWICPGRILFTHPTAHCPHPSRRIFQVIFWNRDSWSGRVGGIFFARYVANRVYMPYKALTHHKAYPSPHNHPLLHDIVTPCNRGWQRGRLRVPVGH